MADSVPAGFVLAKWIGPYDVTVPDREILDENDHGTGEVIPAAYLVSGEDSHLIPEGEAKESEHWRPLSAKRLTEKASREIVEATEVAQPTPAAPGGDR